MALLMLGLRCLAQECCSPWVSTVHAMRTRTTRCPFCGSCRWEVVNRDA